MTSQRYVRANLGLLAAAAACSLVVLVFHAGERVPVHWTGLLEADRHGSALEFALTMPAVAAFLFLVGWVSGAGDGGRARGVVTGLIGLCTGLHVLFSIQTFR